MDKPSYLECLESDYRRLREVAAMAPAAPVPSCPGWTMTDLVRHVAEVYADKTGSLRTGVAQSWPPNLGEAEPDAALESTYGELVAELTSRKPDEPTYSWFGPDQTVGFWARRMAHETVIHRVDAELAAGVGIAPIPDELAVDGADEVLVCFLSYATHEWPEHLGQPLAGCDGRAVRVDAGGASWSVRLNPGGVDVDTGPGPADARVGGAPRDVLLWLWRRVDDDAVRIEGDRELAGRLRDLLGATTQ